MDDEGGKILARPPMGRCQGYLAEVGNLTVSRTERGMAQAVPFGES
jgi:hypothetical protein